MMGKHIRKTLSILTSASALLPFWGCSTSTSGSAVQPESHPMYFPASAQRLSAQKLWMKRVPGLVTDLNLSQDGSTVLVSTIPDRDSLDAGAAKNQHNLIFYSGDGKILAKVEMPAQIKSQTLSADGSFAVIANYDDKLRAYDRTGKELWEVDASCKPFLMNPIHRILCFHDDDAEPELGFEVFDEQGKRLSDYAIKNDALTLKLAPDEKSFILALTHGKVMVFNSDFKPVFQSKVSGEIVDVALESGGEDKPSIAVLYNPKKSATQKLAFFGEKKFEVVVPEHADQVEIGHDGNDGSAFSYGNHPVQMLMHLSEKPAEMWKRSTRSSAEYSSQVVATPGLIWVGFQDQTPVSEHSHVLGFDPKGGLRTDIEVPAEEGSFLYSFSVSAKAHLIAIAADDGQLSLFEFKRP
jgi:hypothetical protein